MELPFPQVLQSRAPLDGARCKRSAKPPLEASRLVEEMAAVKGKRQPVLLGKRGEAILQAVYVYRYMTARDVCHLLYSPSSLAHVRKILTELAGGRGLCGE